MNSNGGDGDKINKEMGNDGVGGDPGTIAAASSDTQVSKQKKAVNLNAGGEPDPIAVIASETEKPKKKAILNLDSIKKAMEHVDAMNQRAQARRDRLPKEERNKQPSLPIYNRRFPTNKGLKKSQKKSQTKLTLENETSSSDEEHDDESTC